MNQKGFSLIELTIVMSVMIILATIAAPQYTTYIDRAKAYGMIPFANGCAAAQYSECGYDDSVNATYLNGLSACTDTHKLLSTGNNISIAPTTADCDNIQVSVSEATGLPGWRAECYGDDNDGVQCKLHSP